MAIDVNTAGKGMRWLAMAMLCTGVASCATTNEPEKQARSKEYFSEKEYGVKASPKVAQGSNIPKGGGRYIVGKSYVVKGKRYYPKEDPSYDRTGIASWYGSAFHGRLTANGEVYDLDHLSAAHPTFPLPSYARVTNVENGSSVIVRVNDRGPYHPGRIIDVSSKTADLLDLKHSGTGSVRVQYVGRARMDEHDMPYLMASYIKKGDRFPAVNPEGQIASGVMVASNQSMGDQLQSYGEAVGSTQTSLAGDTPSAPYGAGASAAGSSAAFQSLVQFATLPESGPIPFDRPSDYVPVPYSPGLAAAYVPVVNVNIAFDAVMERNDGLTKSSILASQKRRGASAIDPTR
ncbi:septal ring lytic transglycosylase RlpA family protein [Ferirhizobium litorale]|uniref:Endolytic peptidoglycan transglycosylase RlpA n=1 Tax=Ferirhizobium litorale TaxID=2927786 RepID=A0AAE3QEL2_9HYPH|nr:septal ring lytic transglycosylase RlpA family protein [Fererhizobium litorale]MDI7924442.1 septal ring lytic transglycosylase RlpA family protein [Fererhizobium litorale]